MARAKTDAKERTEQNKLLVGRASKEAGVAVSRREVLATVRPDEGRRNILPATTADPREYITRGVTGYLTEDSTLDFDPSEVAFVGDVIVEINNLKFYRGGTLVMNVQTTDDFMRTITDAVRLSRGHPLFCRLYELFPRPESPWADGTHPRDDHPPTPGQPHTFDRSEDDI